MEAVKTKLLWKYFLCC